MRFDFTDLNLFRHIVEAGSITHGAERANLALAAASTRIRKMELALGAELLVRGRAGVTPTQAGRTLLQHARAILAQTERLQEDLGPYARGLAGQVRVLSNTNALTEFLPETLSSFLTAYPDISVDLEERLSDEIVGLIAEGAADIGIVAGTVDYGGLHTFPFRSDRFVLVVARNHPLAGARAHRLCRGARLRHGRARPRQRDPALPRRQGEPHRPAVAAARAAALFDAICRLVECNVGVGIVPETTVQRIAKASAIASVRLTDPWASRELTICVRDEDTLPPYARQLVDHLRASA